MGGNLLVKFYDYCFDVYIRFEQRFLKDRWVWKHWYIIYAVSLGILVGLISWANYVGKGRIDIFFLLIALWLFISLASTLRYYKKFSHYILVLWLLILYDTITDIFSVATLLPDFFYSSGIAKEWRWIELWPEIEFWEMMYWVPMWGIATPLRGYVLGNAVTKGIKSRKERLKANFWLFIGTVLIYQSRVEDIIYFTILGYCPFLVIPPLNWSYMPPQGFWDNTKVLIAFWILIIAGLVIHLLVWVHFFRNSNRAAKKS